MAGFKSLIALALAFTATAAPVTETNTADLQARQGGGDITYFNPGLGACGWQNGDNDYIVAVSAGLFDSQRPCGNRINVSYQGRTVNVEVVDRCAGCQLNDLDLSPAAFADLVGSLDAGRVQGSWTWA